MSLDTHMGITRRRVVSDDSEGVSLTQQHFTDECDINQIVNRFQQTGILTHLKETQAQYGYAPAQTFTEAMFTVATATENFNQLPSEVRAHFNHDVAQFLDAASDPSQRAVFEDLGLVEKGSQIIDEPPSAEPVEALKASPSPETPVSDALANEAQT